MAQTVYQTKLLRDAVMGFDALSFVFHLPAAWERERSQGGILAGGDFRPPFGRKYNRLPLDGVTRITLLQWKGKLFPFLPPGEGGFGQRPIVKFRPGDA